MTLAAAPATSECLRRRLARVLDPATRTPAARLVRYCDIAAVLIGLAELVLASDPAYNLGLRVLVAPLLAGFAVMYGLRLWVAPELMAGFSATQARWRWATSALGLVDLAGAIAIPVALAWGVPSPMTDMLGVLWVFKLARYSHGLTVLGRVVQIEAEPLLGVLFAFLVILLCAAVLAYLIEGPHQPEAFGSVPRALWWTIVTLTTTGYGDVTPATPLGRVLGGAVMVCGIMVFALWAGILATGFSQEMRRRAFLKTWDLVARVPLFRTVGPTVISEVAQRLRPREVNPGTVILRKGEVGDCMYFIVSGAIAVEVRNTVLHLQDGDFMGELALITGARRNATATATQPTQLLMLDIADFRDLVARHPDLTAAIHCEAERRLDPNRQDAPLEAPARPGPAGEQDSGS